MTWLFGKLKGYLALAGGLVLALGYAFMRGRSAGKTSTTEAVRKEASKTQEKWDEIDARRPDLDASLDRLRDRARRGD